MSHDLFQELVKHLSDLVLVYRHLLDTVRKEKQLLLKADLIQLKESNAAKEKMLAKIKSLESLWLATAHKIYNEFGKKTESPRLLEVANLLSGAQQEKLMQLRSVLNLLIQRTAAVNKQNEVLTQSALAHISGAMKAIKKTLNKNSNYEKKGTRSETQAETSGRLVSKEV